MRPAIHDNLVLYSPVPHAERLAAGMSLANSDGKMHSREYSPFVPWSIAKLARNALAAALLGGAVLAMLVL